MSQKLDILAIAAHPDDAEISAGGTLARMVDQGSRVGILDLTRGELGTRGSADLRDKEAEASAEILGLHARHNLDLGDGFFQVDGESKLRVIEQIRRFKPDIVLCNAVSDRHPDHGRGSQLASESCFLSGLPKILTTWQEESQEAWRPRVVAHYIQDFYLEPDFVIDVSDYFDTKMRAIEAFGSQFFDPKSTEPKTPISGEEFFEVLRGRAQAVGRPAGISLAEGFTMNRIFGISDLKEIL